MASILLCCGSEPLGVINKTETEDKGAYRLATTTIRTIESVNQNSFPRPRTSVALNNGHCNFGLITADALEGLKSLPNDVFNVVVTSPL